MLVKELYSKRPLSPASTHVGAAIDIYASKLLFRIRPGFDTEITPEFLLIHKPFASSVTS
jgi:hypothetical protein